LSGYRRFWRASAPSSSTFAKATRTTRSNASSVRTLLIHAYRRVLLRDPLLPPALLPLDWPGSGAYALCRDFYRLTHRDASGTSPADAVRSRRAMAPGRRRVLSQVRGPAAGMTCPGVQCTIEPLQVL
jgi:DNA-binding transcriptional regulator PaaX